MDNQIDTQTHQKSKRGMLISIFIALLIIVVVIYIVYKVFFLGKYEETDNAYVNGNIVSVNSEISGTVVAVYANDTNLVHEGDVLVKLNNQDAQINLNKAKAALGNAVRSLAQQYASVNQYKALLKQQQLNLDKTTEDYQRRISLAKNSVISQEELLHTKNAMLSAKAALEVTKEQEKVAEASTQGVDIINHPSVIQAKQSFIQAWLNLRRTNIVSPVSGYIAKKNVQVGSMISPSSPLLSVVPLNNLWIDANFKETQLKNVKVNQKVTINTDLYGKSITYTGRVVGLSAGTGSAFSLLPAQNATGNWIKIVQRLPVRIALDNKELQKNPLRIGLSATVKVDINNQSGESLSSYVNDNSLYTTSVVLYDLSKAEEQAKKIISQNIVKQTFASKATNKNPMKKSNTGTKKQSPSTTTTDKNPMKKSNTGTKKQSPSTTTTNKNPMKKSNTGTKKQSPSTTITDKNPMKKSNTGTKKQSPSTTTTDKNPMKKSNTGTKKQSPSTTTTDKNPMKNYDNKANYNSIYTSHYY